MEWGTSLQRLQCISKEDLSNDSLTSTCSHENYITHTRKGLLRSPSGTPKDDDVLLGRGKGFHSRKGNVRFRDRIRAHCKIHEGYSKSGHICELHKMYDDLHAVGRFLKYDHVHDEFSDAAKGEVIRKMSQAIQYEKRTRKPERENELSPSRTVAAKKGSLSNRRICSDDESKPRSTKSDLLGGTSRSKRKRSVPENFEGIHGMHNRQSLPLDFDVLLSDTIDDVLGKREA